MPAARNVLSPVLISCLALGAHACRAGGGPENVLLVVNQNSQDSLTVANYYARLRDIPAGNVLYLDWKGELDWTERTRFRDEILKPVLQAIDDRKLSAQIDYVVYSCDFPWAVKCRDLFPGLKGPDLGRKVASITGATFLYPYVLQNTPAIVSLASNWYVPDATHKNLNQCTSLAGVESQGFRSRYSWQRGGKKLSDLKKGQRYLLSAMLGVTQGQGNTVEEITRYLIAADSADATQPKGAFYFMQNSDVRSTTRHACFEGVAEQLEAEGATARVLNGKIPKRAKDVVGITAGAAQFDAPAADLRVMPGAICEHLTSFGGDFRNATKQTTLADFMRAGAAGASGTVIEPFAIQAKFPLPSIHLHYYRGCSLGEAFYQAIAAPYQILIVGDPLCQPWAKPPQCRLEWDESKPVAGNLTLRPRLSNDAELCEVFVDGRLIAILPKERGFSLPTTNLADGHHEVRAVAVGKNATEPRGRRVVNLQVDNQPGGSLALVTTPALRVKTGQPITIRAVAPEGVERVVFLQNNRVIGDASGPKFEAKLEPAAVGRGPVRLIASDPVSGQKSPPVWLWIE